MPCGPATTPFVPLCCDAPLDSTPAGAQPGRAEKHRRAMERVRGQDPMQLFLQLRVTHAGAGKGLSRRQWPFHITQQARLRAGLAMGCLLLVGRRPRLCMRCLIGGYSPPRPTVQTLTFQDPYAREASGTLTPTRYRTKAVPPAL